MGKNSQGFKSKKEVQDSSAKDYLLKGHSAFLSGLSAIDLQSRPGGRKL